MSPLLAFFIGLIIGGAGAGIGVAVHDQGLPAKTVIQNQYTTQQVTTESKSIQQVDQSQTVISVVNDKTNFKYVSVNGVGKTNFHVYFSAKTNSKSTTNKNR